MNQLKIGAILSYVTILVINAIGLVLTPFMIQKLGNSEYGLFTLIGSLIAYISVLDFGLNNTIIRFVAKYKAEKNKKSEENFLAISFIIYFLLSAIVVIAGLMLYSNLETTFPKLTLSELQKAKTMFLILIFNLTITLPGGAFSAICSAYEHFIFPRAVIIIKYIARSILVVVLLLNGKDVVSIVILDTFVNIFVIVVNAYYVFKKLNVTIKLHDFNTPLVKEIFSYSIWIFVFAIVGQFQWQAGQVILGVLSSTTAVAIYGVGIMLGTYYGAFSSAISGVFLPMATKMTVVNASNEDLTTMMIRIGRFSFIVLMFIFGGFFIFGKQFIILWVGTDYIDAWLIALVVMIGYTIPLLQSFANSILEARNKFSYKAIVYISLITLGTAFGAYLYQFYGSLGIVMGSTLGWIIAQIIMNFYYHNVIKINILRFFVELLKNVFPTFIIISISGYFLNYIPGSSWVNLLIKIIIYCFIFILLMFKFGLNKDEIQIFTSLIPNKLKRK